MCWVVSKGSFLSIFPRDEKGEIIFNEIASRETTQDMFLTPADHYVPHKRNDFDWNTNDAKRYILSAKDETMIFFKISDEWIVAVLKRELKQLVKS